MCWQISPQHMSKAIVLFSMYIRQDKIRQIIGTMMLSKLKFQLVHERNFTKAPKEIIPATHSIFLKASIDEASHHDFKEPPAIYCWTVGCVSWWQRHLPVCLLCVNPNGGTWENSKEKVVSWLQGNSLRKRVKTTLAELYNYEHTGLMVRGDNTCCVT